MLRAEGVAIPRSEVATPEVGPANWTPLELRIGSRCAEFMWMYRQSGYEYYKHIDTRRYIILDSRGACFRRQGSDLIPADFHDELRRVTEGLDD
jgi:hypothetical protein